RANLDLRLGRHRVGAALHPVHRLLHRLHLPEPVARDQFLGLGEWTVSNGTAVPGELDPLAGSAPLQALPRNHDAPLDELFVEGPHLPEHLLIAGIDLRLGLLRRLHDHHHAHRSLLSLRRASAHSYVEWSAARSTTSCENFHDAKAA